MLYVQKTSDAEVREIQGMIKVTRIALAWLTKGGGVYSLLQCR